MKRILKQISRQLLTFSLSLLLSAACISAVCPGASLFATAHSGGTDASGGHHDYHNKSGLGPYHYHHGYPAHLHENGICPYENALPVPDTEPALPMIDDEILYPDEEESAIVPEFSAPDYTKVFDAAFYAAANPDVAAVCGADAALLFQHFLSSGMQEGRQGNAAFNVHAYRAANPALDAAFGNDLPQYYLWYCTH